MRRVRPLLTAVWLAVVVGVAIHRARAAHADHGPAATPGAAVAPVGDATAAAVPVDAQAQGPAQAEAAPPAASSAGSGITPTADFSTPTDRSAPSPVGGVPAPASAASPAASSTDGTRDAAPSAAHATADPAPRPAAARDGGPGPRDRDGLLTPGRATPVAAATPTTVDVLWDGHGLYDTTITIAGGGDGLRRTAVVHTRDRQGRIVASYAGTAFVDADGATHVDARGATVSGSMAGWWSPDSFRIGADRTVTTLDDQGQRRTGTAQPLATN